MIVEKFWQSKNDHRSTRLPRHTSRSGKILCDYYDVFYVQSLQIVIVGTYSWYLLERFCVKYEKYVINVISLYVKKKKILKTMQYNSHFKKLNCSLCIRELTIRYLFQQKFASSYLYICFNFFINITKSFQLLLPLKIVNIFVFRISSQ